MKKKHPSHNCKRRVICPPQYAIGYALIFFGVGMCFAIFAFRYTLWIAIACIVIGVVLTKLCK